jgi:hypothetical protein
MSTGILLGIIIERVILQLSDKLLLTLKQDSSMRHLLSLVALVIRLRIVVLEEQIRLKRNFVTFLPLLMKRTVYV